MAYPPRKACVATVGAIAGSMMIRSAAMAASPSPAPLGVQAGDVRAGEAPGLAGGPVEVLLLVITLGIATMLVTVALALAVGRRAH